MKSYSINIILLSLILTACSDQGNMIETWQHEDIGSYASAISPDGRFLMTGSIGGYGRVWDLKNNKVLYSIQHEESDEGGVLDAAFSADSKVLVTIEHQSIARWNMSDGRLTGYWKWPDLKKVAISADGRYALIGMKVRQAIYFDMVAGKMIYVFPHHEKMTAVALSKDGRFALTGADDWNASLWNLKTGKHIWSKNMNYKIANVTLSDNGEYALVNAYIKDANIYSTNKAGTLISSLEDKRMTVVSADFSDNNKLLAVGRAAKSINIYDVKTGKKIKGWRPKVKHLVQPDSATILDLKFGKNAKTLVSESSTGIGQLWSLE